MLKIISLQQDVCGRTYKIFSWLMENYRDIYIKLIVRRKESTIFEELKYAYVPPEPLIQFKFTGYDYFIRYYGPFNRLYGNKIRNTALKEDGDIIHSHGPPDDLGFLGKKYTDKPVVHEVFDTASLYDKSNYGGWIKGPIIEKLGLVESLRKRLRKKDLMWEKYIHENADGLVYTSQYMLDAVNEMYDCVEGIIIPNAVLKNDISRQKLPKLSEINGETHTVYVGWIGLSRGHRNIFPYLEKISQRDIHVHIYGVGPPADISKLKRISSKNPYLHFHEPLPYKELYKELTQYDFGFILLAPFNEKLLNVAIPNKLYEYLANDLPIIVSPYKSLTDFVKKRNCGFILEHVDDIESKIGKKYNIGYKDEYTIDYHLPKLIKLYEKLTG